MPMPVLPPPPRYQTRIGDVECDGLEGIQLRIDGKEAILRASDAAALAAWLSAEAEREALRR